MSTVAQVATTATALDPIKQIDAGVLNVGYVDAGPSSGPTVILLHGWPYDIHAFVDVCPRLAAAGYRLIIPYLRGYGSTSFLSSETFRNGQPSALALDVTRGEGHGRHHIARLGATDDGLRSNISEVRDKRAPDLVVSR
jgi:pimeloyl-ACP methyl ester carboxylesterase